MLQPQLVDGEYVVDRSNCGPDGWAKARFFDFVSTDSSSEPALPLVHVRFQLSVELV
jgi:hypothetical protein